VILGVPKEIKEQEYLRGEAHGMKWKKPHL
jgi:hypothetical protein